MTTIVPLCITCKHRVENGLRCPAYPHDIPMAVLLNKLIHNKVLQGQAGETVYEPLPEYAGMEIDIEVGEPEEVDLEEEGA